MLLAVYSGRAAARCPVVEAVRDAPDRPTPVAVQVGIGPGPTEHALSPHLSERLQTVFDRDVSSAGKTAIGAAVLVPDLGRWTAIHNANAEEIFGVGTIGQAATAALVLNNAARGRVSLADPVSRWFPQLRGASENTVDQLLTHHSGYRSFDDLPALRRRIPAEHPQRLMRFSVRRSGEACPSHAHHHSNTNYLILGLILEQEHDQLFHEIELDHILAPLGLHRSAAMERGMPPPELLATLDARGRPFTSVDYGALHGAGNLAMTPRELATFWHALLAGQVVPPAQVDQMLSGWTRVPTPPQAAETYSGRGLLLFRSPDGKDWLVGQVNTTRGFGAMVAWSSALDAVIAVASNGPSAPETAFWSLYRALADALATPELR